MPSRVFDVTLQLHLPERVLAFARCRPNKRCQVVDSLHAAETPESFERASPDSSSSVSVSLSESVSLRHHATSFSSPML